MTHPQLTHNRQLVLRVNELFHDLENKEYEHVHPEIFEHEKQRWDRMLKTHLSAADTPRTIVDIGAGTGFVGERLLAHMKPADTLICADISAKMLEICTEKLRAVPGAPTVTALKMEDEHIALPDNCAAVVTMNSVLHHLPDSHLFLSEIVRILQPGGFLYIGHEPNRRFYSSAALAAQVQLLRHISPARAAALVLKKTGRSTSSIMKKDTMLDAINEQLLKEQVITAPLTRSELSASIDTHSPTAGGMNRTQEGFDPFTVLNPWTNMQIQAVETYNHLSKLSGKKKILKHYERLLEHLFPKTGATFFMVASKHTGAAHTRSPE